MGCTTTAVTAAVLATTATVAFAYTEKRQTIKLSKEGSDKTPPANFSFWRELAWLSGLFWGGAGLLVLRHFVLGEALGWLAFIPEDFNLGILIVGLSLLIWTGLLLLSRSIKKRQRRSLT